MQVEDCPPPTVQKEEEGVGTPPSDKQPLTHSSHRENQIRANLYRLTEVNFERNAIPIDIDVFLEKIKTYRKNLQDLLDRNTHPAKFISSMGGEQFIDAILAAENARAPGKTAWRNPELRLDNGKFASITEFVRHIDQMRRKLGNNSAPVALRGSVQIDKGGHSLYCDVVIRDGKTSVVGIESVGMRAAVSAAEDFARLWRNFPDTIHNVRIFATNTQKAAVGCESCSVTNGLKSSRFRQEIDAAHEENFDADQGSFKIIIDSTGKNLHWSVYKHAQSLSQVIQVLQHLLSEEPLCVKVLQGLATLQRKPEIKKALEDMRQVDKQTPTPIDSVEAVKNFLYQEMCVNNSELKDPSYREALEVIFSHPLFMHHIKNRVDQTVYNLESRMNLDQTFNNSIDRKRIKELTRVIEYVEGLVERYGDEAGQIFANQLARVSVSRQPGWDQYIPSVRSSVPDWDATKGLSQLKRKSSSPEKNAEIVNELLDAIPHWDASSSLRIEAVMFILEFIDTIDRQEKVALSSEIIRKIPEVIKQLAAKIGKTEEIGQLLILSGKLIENVSQEQAICHLKALMEMETQSDMQPYLVQEIPKLVKNACRQAGTYNAEYAHILLRMMNINIALNCLTGMDKLDKFNILKRNTPLSFYDQKLKKEFEAIIALCVNLDEETIRLLSNREDGTDRHHLPETLRDVLLDRMAEKVSALGESRPEWRSFKSLEQESWKRPNPPSSQASPPKCTVIDRDVELVG